MHSVLILGSGHLAHRLRTMAAARGCRVVQLPELPPRTPDHAGSTFEDITRRLDALDLDAVDAAFLVDDRDERNLEELLALYARRATIRIVASFYNQNITPHLEAAYPDVRILSPVAMAAPVFLAALDAPLERTLGHAPAKPPERPDQVAGDILIRNLLVAFVALIAGSTAFFHMSERLGWLDALYFVIVTVATVGYGDISLAQSSDHVKIAGIALILGSTFFIWTIFSLTVDRIIKRRAQLALGRRHYNCRDHVILCGLGRLGWFVADGLLKRGERVIIVEQNENAPAVEVFRARGADVYIGDASLPRVLHDVGVTRAKALYSVIDADYVNLEVGLNARAFAPGLRVVLRIFDLEMSQALARQLDIHLTYSMTAIADNAFFDAARIGAQPAA